MRISTSSVLLIGCIASSALAFTPYDPEAEIDTDPSHWRPIVLPEDDNAEKRIEPRSPRPIPFNPTVPEDIIGPNDVWVPVPQLIEALEGGKSEQEAIELLANRQEKVFSFPLRKIEGRTLYERDPVAWVSAETDRLAAKYGMPVAARSRLRVKREGAKVDMASPRRPVANNSAELHNDGRDMAYLVDVELGSQGQKLKMVVDTGSSDTWVYGQACEKKACLAHTRYDHSLSSDFKEEDLPFTVHYGTGDSKGNFVTDRMKVGDFDFVTKFGIISEASDVFIGFPLDGILALGFNNVSMSGQPGFLEELYSNKLIDRRTFGLALSKTNESIHDGVINFGGYDPTYFNGDLQFRNVTNQNMAAYWQVPVEEIKHNDQVINKHGKHGILDSGTSMMVAPYWDASHLHSGIPGALTNGNSFQVPCSTKDTMELKLNGISFKLMPEDWIGKPVAGSKDACISLISGHKVEHEAYLGKTTWLLGAAFMRNAYVYFDVDNMRIGLAEKRPKAERLQAWEDEQAVGSGKRKLVVTDQKGPLEALAVNGNVDATASASRAFTSIAISVFIAATSVALLMIV